MIEEDTTRRIKEVIPYLNEHQRRIYLAAEAEALGRGGITAISDLAGVHRNTISAGLKELRSGEKIPEDGKVMGRVRRKGGGRKSIEQSQQGIADALEGLVDNSSYGNPENPLRWTTKSLRNLADELTKEGFPVSHNTVGKILKELGFSLQSNRKMEQVGVESPDRDAQFQHINSTAAEYIGSGDPVISIDCKKKENIGNFQNNGVEYAPKKSPLRVLDHDFPIAGQGKAVPYGIYDVANNEGYVNVGISKETAAFAVQSIRTWWKEMGRVRFPNASRLFITADGGGSNGSRCRLWKMELQGLANELGLPIEVSHFPPGTSKWNKIEHRMFSQISKNWRGRPLETLEIIVNLIASTTTDSGLRIKCGIDKHTYTSGTKISDEGLQTLNLVKGSFHGDWNYILYPCP